jgi:hypothetical protein
VSWYFIKFSSTTICDSAFHYLSGHKQIHSLVIEWYLFLRSNYTWILKQKSIIENALSSLYLTFTSISAMLTNRLQSVWKSSNPYWGSMVAFVIFSLSITCFFLGDMP